MFYRVDRPHNEGVIGEWRFPADTGPSEYRILAFLEESGVLKNTFIRLIFSRKLHISPFLTTPNSFQSFLERFEKIEFLRPAQGVQKVDF